MRGLIALTIFAAACSSSSAEQPATPPVGSGHGNCADRSSATYLVTLEEKSGTCGANGSQVVVQGSSVSASTSDGGAGGCIGKATPSADGCEVQYDTDCPSKSQAGVRIKESGKAEFSVDSSYGTAVETLVLDDENGNVLCTSTYGLTYRRQ